jgi:hypothetical protein
MPMSFYGVEWDPKVGSYRFDVGYDRDAVCGLDQRDVYVCERTPIQRVPLKSLSGRWLLDAYQGADRQERVHAYAAAVAQVETDAALALAARPTPAPDAPSAKPKTGRWQRKKQRRAIESERRQVMQRLEQALARELGALPYDQFDLQRLQAQVTRYDGPHFLRSFYFAEMNERHIRNRPEVRSGRGVSGGGRHRRDRVGEAQRPLRAQPVRRVHA